jgi:CRP/FNR family transcriptional regulator, dissimilatory nitrate respiration regulator
MKKNQKNTDILGETPLFSGLPEDQIRAVEAIAVEKSLTRGEIIFSEGDAGNGFYVVASGSVKVYKVSSEGKEQILHIFGTGEPFGEVPVFSGQRFPANAQAIKVSRVLFFHRDRFVSLVVKNPSLALNMLAVLSVRLRQFTRQIENLSLKEVPARLATYLIYLSEEQKDRERVRLAISKGQLASLLGTIPETLSRIFTRMASQNLIRVKGREIELMDRGALADLAE